jgi:hypothetical protein
VLRRLMSCCSTNVGKDKLYSSSATLPTCRPDASGRDEFTLGSYGVHDFAKELVSPLY